MAGSVQSSELPLAVSSTITENTNPINEAGEVKDSDVAGLKTITIESLTSAWNGFTEQIRSEDKRLYSMLTAHLPQLEGDTKIVFTISNSLQKEPLQKIETRLLQHLQKVLENKNVEIQFVVSENPEIVIKAFTNEDKFSQMCIKNPALLTFKQQFMLDFA